MGASVIITFFPIVQRKIESKNRKSYFQFWASQCLFLGLAVWTLIKNHSTEAFESVNNLKLAYFTLMISGTFIPILMSVIVCIFLRCPDMNTPTQCCCCCRGLFRVTAMGLSILITTTFSLPFPPSSLSTTFILFRL